MTTTTTTGTTIFVYVPAALAVERGCQHGWHPVRVDATKWSPAERALLASSVVEQDGARYGRPNHHMSGRQDVDPYSCAPTEEALRAHVAARVATREAEATAAREAEALRASERAERLRTMPPLDLARWESREEIERVGRTAEVAKAVAARDAQQAAASRAEAQARAELAARHEAEIRACLATAAPQHIERWEEGMVPTEELRRILERAIIGPIAEGFGTKPDFDREQTWSASSSMSASAYEALKRLRARVSESGQRVEISTDRATLYHRDPDDEDADSDGDVEIGAWYTATIVGSLGGMRLSRRVWLCPAT